MCSFQLSLMRVGGGSKVEAVWRRWWSGGLITFAERQGNLRYVLPHIPHPLHQVLLLMTQNNLPVFEKSPYYATAQTACKAYATTAELVNIRVDWATHVTLFDIVSCRTNAPLCTGSGAARR